MNQTTFSNLVAAIVRCRAATIPTDTENAAATLNSALNKMAVELRLTDAAKREKAVKDAAQFVIEAAVSAEATYIAKGEDASDAAESAAESAASGAVEHFQQVAKTGLWAEDDPTAPTPSKASAVTTALLLKLCNFSDKIGVHPAHLLTLDERAIAEWRAGDETFFLTTIRVTSNNELEKKKLVNVTYFPHAVTINGVKSTSFEVSEKEAKKLVTEFVQQYITATPPPVVEAKIIRALLSTITIPNAHAGDSEDDVRKAFLEVWDEYRCGKYNPTVSALGYEIGKVANTLATNGCREDEEFGSNKDLRLTTLASAASFIKANSKGGDSPSTIKEIAAWVIKAGVAKMNPENLTTRTKLNEIFAELPKESLPEDTPSPAVDAHERVSVKV